MIGFILAYLFKSVYKDKINLIWISFFQILVFVC